MVEKARRHRTSVLWIAFNPASTETSDQVERASQGCRVYTLAAVPLAHLAARDPPVRRPGLSLLGCGAVLDPWYLVWLAELAPADAIASVEDERRMCGSCTD